MKKLLIFICLLVCSGVNQAQNHLWTKSIGGAENDYAYGVTLDANGSVYSAGSFSSMADFDPGSGTYTLNPNLSADVLASVMAGG